MKLTQAICDAMMERGDLCVFQYVRVCEERECLYNCSEWLGYTSRIRVDRETGYATPTRNVTVPLCVRVCSGS